MHFNMSLEMYFFADVIWEWSKEYIGFILQFLWYQSVQKYQ